MIQWGTKKEELAMKLENRQSEYLEGSQDRMFSKGEGV
jgi:hypothetical protein